jgi:hypothetical protein
VREVTASRPGSLAQPVEYHQKSTVGTECTPKKSVSKDVIWEVKGRNLCFERLKRGAIIALLGMKIRNWSVGRPVRNVKPCTIAFRSVSVPPSPWHQPFFRSRDPSKTRKVAVKETRIGIS